jgi:hypothetical protein
MSASMSVSSKRMRTDLSPCLRCLRWRRIRCAAGEDERVGEMLLMVLLDAALHLVYELSYRCHYAHRRPSAARLVQIMVPTWGGSCRAFHRPAIIDSFLTAAICRRSNSVTLTERHRSAARIVADRKPTRWHLAKTGPPDPHRCQHNFHSETPANPLRSNP